MMKKVIVVIILTIFIFFGLLFTIPISFLSETYSNSGLIDEYKSFYYNPTSFNITEELNLEIVRGEVDIKYVYPPNDFIVKIDVYFEISGVNALGKSYIDYFDIVWENSSSPLNFTMVYKSSIEELEVLSLFSNISIIVSLGADVTFDIKADIDEGEVDQCLVHL